MAYVPDQLRSIAQKIQAGETPEPVTVRTVVAWFGFERRGSFVVQWMRSGLSEVGLVTEPDFNSVWIDSYVTFRPVPKEETPTGPRVDEAGAKLQLSKQLRPRS